MEMVASRMARVGCVAPAAKRLAPTPRTPRTANRARTPRIIAVRTSPIYLRHWRSKSESRLKVQLLLSSINSTHTRRQSGDEAPHAPKVESARLREDLEERGRGFSMNQVQNGGTHSLWFGLGLSAPEMTTGCEFPLIMTGSGSPVGSFTSRVRTSLTTIAFMPITSPRLQRDR